MSAGEGRVPSAGDPCPVCQPVGHLRLDSDGHLSCSNCLWNSEDDTGRGTSPSDECPQCGVLARSLPCIDWRGEVMATPHAGRGPITGRTPSPVNLADRRRITAPEHVWAAHGHPGEVCESLSPERPFLCALRAEKEADRG